jgi:hypothetical protein
VLRAVFYYREFKSNAFVASFIPSELTRAARLVSTAVAMAATAITALPQAHAAGVSGQGTWETTLQGRDLDGNAANGYEAYYDTALNITWLANAGAFAGTWDDAKSWATNLDVNGTTGWRLPTMVVTGAPSCSEVFSGSDCGYNVNTNTSEFAHMFYVTLGNKAAFDTSGNRVQSGWGPTNTGPFKSVQPDPYWSGLEYAGATDGAWTFNFGAGNQSFNYMGSVRSAWAVHPGDVTASVPEPETYGLALAGLFVVRALARRRRAA